MIDINNIQIIIDEWEGNNNSNDQVFIANGAKGNIVRINSMSGGHHMDTSFVTKWETAKQYYFRAPYFVYNPWVNGIQNYDWLMSHLPKDVTHKIFVDLEVRYSGITPSEYYKQSCTCINKILNSNPVSIYTGQGFLDIMTPWLTPHDYWWAAYPLELFGEMTWERLKEKLSKLSFCFNKSKCPGTVKLWQAVADNTILPGGGGKAIDVSFFEGSVEQLGEYFGYSESEIKIITSGSSSSGEVDQGGNVTTNVYSTRAKGIYVEDKYGKIDPAKLQGLDFLIAKVGTKFTDNVQSSYDAKVPLILFYQNDPELYLNMGLNPLKWPSADNDPQIAILDNMILSGGTKRAIHGIMLDCSKVQMTAEPTKYLTPAWIVQNGQYMLNMIWNRYKIPVYMYMNKSPLSIWANDSNGKEMLYAFIKSNGVSTVSLVKPENMEGIIPIDGQVPTLPYEDKVHWYFWLYYAMSDGLRFIYDGDRKALFTELNYVDPIAPIEPPVDNGGGDEVIPVVDNELLNKIYDLLAEMAIKMDKISKHFAD